MDTLVGHSKLKIEHKQVLQQKQEYKFIGSVARKKGQFLFALDLEENRVYKIETTVKKAFDVTKKQEIGHYQAQINPNHPFIYALNKENAVKKFKKLYADFN